MYFKTFMLLCVYQLSSVSCRPRNIDSDGYSFQEFSGPVSGQIHEVQVNTGPHGAPKVDFVARPDYQFAYGVEEPRTGTAQAHQESRSGDDVRGEYSVLQSDGALRIVRYTADPLHGFRATVEYKRF